jgi:hypothetical protein
VGGHNVTIVDPVRGLVRRECLGLHHVKTASSRVLGFHSRVLVAEWIHLGVGVEADVGVGQFMLEIGAEVVLRLEGGVVVGEREEVADLAALGGVFRDGLVAHVVVASTAV